MVGGGLMQLVAYGAQDIYLTGNPQITFFKVVYRRHTNFAVESIEQVFNGQADFGRKVTATISRNGDLIHKIYLVADLPDVTVPANTWFRWLNWVGHILIKSVEVEVGGQRLDKHYGDWLQIWNELTQTAGHQLGYANLVGNTPDLTNPVEGPATIKGKKLYIPLQFWFNRNPGLALPLIALQYHEVKINLELADAADCYWSAPDNAGTPGAAATLAGFPSLNSCSLYVDYIYLDTDERRRFAQTSHEYLIDQLQFTGDESTSSVANKIKLNFNHPTKELVFVVQPDANVAATAPYGKQWFNYTDAFEGTSYPQTGLEGVAGAAAGGATRVFMPASFAGGANPVATGKLQLNGHDRFDTRDGRWFSLLQPYAHHENVPSQGINVFSFALKPEDHQPSGTCNFSRIDSAVLQLQLTQAAVANNRSVKVRVYAVNYNVLRIMSGMGGLAFSN
jgi:hypothetical protein